MNLLASLLAFPLLFNSIQNSSSFNKSNFGADFSSGEYAYQLMDKFFESPNTISALIRLDKNVTNNSSYAVKYADFKYNITKDGVKEGSYLTFSDTILAGETSSISECFGSDDMELISIELTLVDAEGNDIYVEYDVKLNQMEIW